MGQPTVVNERVRDALDGLSARDLEEMQKLIEERLRKCALCSADGALPLLVTTNNHSKYKSIRASLLLCPACFEKHRLPEKRSETPQNA